MGMWALFKKACDQGPLVVGNPFFRAAVPSSIARPSLLQKWRGQAALPFLDQDAGIWTTYRLPDLLVSWLLTSQGLYTFSIR